MTSIASTVQIDPIHAQRHYARWCNSLSPCPTKMMNPPCLSRRVTTSGSLLFLTPWANALAVAPRSANELCNLCSTWSLRGETRGRPNGDTLWSIPH